MYSLYIAIDLNYSQLKHKSKEQDSPTSILYLWGCLASSMIGMTFVLFLATLMRSRPDLWENSTAYTRPSYSVRKNTKKGNQYKILEQVKLQKEV